MYTSPSLRGALLRTAALGAGIATLAIALTAAPALTLSPSPGADAAVPTCVPGYSGYPNLNGGTSAGTDTGVSVYAAGDLTTGPGAVEGEGQLVIGGDAAFRGDHFSLGVVGVGSRVDPPAGSDMLVAGGDVSVTAGFLDVGHGLGGNIVSGGSVGPRELIETNGGDIDEGVANPLAPYAATAAHYVAMSADAATTPDTGDVVVTADDVTFTGDDESAVQAFTVSGSELGELGATRTMIFAAIPPDAVVIVNVTGTTPVLSANTFELNGTPIVPDSRTTPAFSRFTQSLLWNFSAADSVTLGDEDQLLGSVLVPRAGSTIDLLTSTNGRIFAGGDIRFGDGERQGLELHNYPFREPVGCAAATGSLSITKSLDDPDGVVVAGRIYTGEYECRSAADAVVATGDWSLRAGDTFVTPAIPVASTCVVTEDQLDTSPSATDASYRWKTPRISPGSTRISDSTTPTEVTVTNSVRRVVGDLAVRKVLDDPDSVVDTGRTYTGTFTCRYNGADVTPASHTWSIGAGATTIIATGLAEGTECSVTEDEPTVSPLAGSTKYGWADPLYSAASVIVDDDATATVVVTNIVGMVDDVSVTNDGGDDDSDGGSVVSPAATDDTSQLAATGVEIGTPLVISGAALVLGAVLLLVARRRRLRKHA